MPASKAQQKAVNKYMAANYDRINLTMPKGGKDAIKAHAEKNGESVNGFINRAVAEATGTDNMHRAYQRVLLQRLGKMKDALSDNNLEEANNMLDELIEYTQKDIAE